MGSGSMARASRRSPPAATRHSLAVSSGRPSISSTASFTSYTRDGFGPEDQIALRDLAWELKRRGVTVILSNHDVPQVRELYADFEIKQILVGRAINSKASKRGRVAEVIIT